MRFRESIEKSLGLDCKRTHKSCKALERSRNANLRVDLNEDVLLRVNEDL